MFGAASWVAVYCCVAFQDDIAGVICQCIMLPCLGMFLGQMLGHRVLLLCWRVLWSHLLGVLLPYVMCSVMPDDGHVLLCCVLCVVSPNYLQVLSCCMLGVQEHVV